MPCTARRRGFMLMSQNTFIWLTWISMGTLLEGAMETLWSTFTCPYTDDYLKHTGLRPKSPDQSAVEIQYSMTTRTTTFRFVWSGCATFFCKCTVLFDHRVCQQHCVYWLYFWSNLFRSLPHIDNMSPLLVGDLPRSSWFLWERAFQDRWRWRSDHFYVAKILLLRIN